MPVEFVRLPHDTTPRQIHRLRRHGRLRQEHAGGHAPAAADIRSVAEVAIRGRWPDLTIILDLPTDASMNRVRPKFSLFPEDPDAGMEKDRIEQRPLAYHEQVRGNYLEQAKADPQRYRVIPADRERAEVHEDVWRAVKGLI